MSTSQVPSRRPLGLLGACLGAGAVLALLAFLFLGLTLWTAALALLLLVCPALIGWGVLVSLRTRTRPRKLASME